MAFSLAHGRLTKSEMNQTMKQENKNIQGVLHVSGKAYVDGNKEVATKADIADISTNTADISTNAANISTRTADISRCTSAFGARLARVDTVPVNGGA